MTNLDSAWREVEDALPDGWAISALDHILPHYEARTGWQAEASEIQQGMWSGTNIEAFGTTPQEALHHLAQALREKT
jgi:hypothetical protein